MRLNTPTTRRRVIAEMGFGALGLAGAALLGCGRQSGPATVATSTPAPITAATGVEILPLTAPVAQGKPRKGGTFSESIGAVTWRQHDSHTQLGASEWHVISEKVLEADPLDAKTLPAIATSWEVADPNGLTLVFKVKPGVKIHNVPPWNGREFDAEDVAWNLERIGGLYADRLKIPVAAFQRSSMVQNIKKAEAVDKHTVKVTLSAPNSGLFRGISENRTMLMPKEMDDIGYKDPMKFGSMGPYQITEFKIDQVQRYKKFEGYSSFRPNEPSFDEFVLQAIPDRASTIAAFSGGQIHLLGGVVPDEMETIKKTKADALLYAWIDCNWHHIRPNMAYAPFKDIRVRKAIHYAMDYADIGNLIFGSGWGYQAVLSPGFPEAWKPGKVRGLPGYNPDTKANDRAEAKKMIAGAGFPDGKGIDFETIFISTSDQHRDIATRFKSQMQQVFPEMKIGLKGLDQATFATQQASGQFQMLAYTITSTPDAVLEAISQYHTTGSRNYGKFTDKAHDALLDKALAELNTEARNKQLDEYQQKWVDEWHPQYVLYANAARSMIPGNVGGYDKLAGTWYGYSSWTKVARLSYLDK